MISSVTIDLGMHMSSLLWFWLWYIHIIHMVDRENPARSHPVCSLYTLIFLLLPFHPPALWVLSQHDLSIYPSSHFTVLLLLPTSATFLSRVS